MTVPSNEPGSLGYIDAVRGLAIMGVVLVHVTQRVTPLSEPFVRWGWSGARGVQLFFLASALTLIMSWHAKQDGALAFYVRRLFRILPLFWLAIIVYASVKGSWTEWQLWVPQAIFMNAFDPVLMWGGPVPGGWSIAIEMTFYAAFPLLMLVVRDIRGAVIFFVVVTVFDMVSEGFLLNWWLTTLPPEAHAAARDTHWLGFPGELPIFASGFLVYFAIQRRPPARWLGLILAAVAIALFLKLTLTHQRVSLWGPVFGLIVYGMSAGGLRLLNNRVTRSLGVMSFGIYLVHFLVIQQVLQRLLPSGGGTPAWLLIAYPGVLAACYGIALVLHHLVERPFIGLGRRAARAVGRERPSTKANPLGAS